MFVSTHVSGDFRPPQQNSFPLVDREAEVELNQGLALSLPESYR